MLTAQKYSNSRKDELMVNLKAAALACGVVVTCLGGGIGAACINSSKVNSADVVEECDAEITTSTSNGSQATEVSEAAEKTTSEKKVTTSMETALAKVNTPAGSKSVKTDRNESSTKEISTAVNTAETKAAITAAKVTVPAPVHATVPKAETTEKVTEAQTEPTTEYVATTADSVTAPVPPSTEALTEAQTTIEPNSETAPNDTSGTTVVSITGAGELPITDEEYIILCNAVANEAGSDWISVNDKAKVVEVIMNRVKSETFPNTIYGVLAQPNQFDGAYNYINLGVFSSFVTDTVKEAVDLYFSSPETFSEGYYYFYGDGYQNHFS